MHNIYPRFVGDIYGLNALVASSNISQKKEKKTTNKNEPHLAWSLLQSFEGNLLWTFLLHLHPFCVHTIFLFNSLIILNKISSFHFLRNHHLIVGLTERAFEIIVVIIFSSDLTSRNSFKLGVAYPSFAPLITHPLKHWILVKGFIFVLLMHVYGKSVIKQIKGSILKTKVWIIILYIPNEHYFPSGGSFNETRKLRIICFEILCTSLYC